MTKAALLLIGSPVVDLRLSESRWRAWSLTFSSACWFTRLALVHLGFLHVFVERLAIAKGWLSSSRPSDRWPILSLPSKWLGVALEVHWLSSVSRELYPDGTGLKCRLTDRPVASQYSRSTKEPTRCVDLGTQRFVRGSPCCCYNLLQWTHICEYERA